MLFDVCCLLFVVCCLFIVFVLLVVVWCSLFVVRCLLVVDYLRVPSVISDGRLLIVCCLLFGD